MSYAVVTEWAARSEGAGERKQLHGQQSVVTSSLLPDGWVIWVSLTQFAHQMKLFLLSEVVSAPDCDNASLVQTLVSHDSDIWRQLNP